MIHLFYLSETLYNPVHVLDGELLYLLYNCQSTNENGTVFFLVMVDWLPLEMLASIQHEIYNGKDIVFLMVLI